MSLERWLVELDSIEGLKLSINERGFWANLRAVINEHGEVELCYEHHRLHASLELFAPDYEIAIQVAPFEGEWALQRDLHMENSVNRNKVAHTHEVVYQLVHWFDDKIFEQYPTWDDCLRGGENSTPQLETFFGPNTGGGGGYANYAQCAERGIGRKMIIKMLEGTETEDAIRKALESFPMTERRRRYEAKRAREEFLKAQKLRQDAERWRKEGGNLLEQAQRERQQGKEANDTVQMAAAFELKKQARVLLGKAKAEGISRALEILYTTATVCPPAAKVFLLNSGQPYTIGLSLLWCSE